MNCCFWTAVLEKTLESPLDCKKIQQVHPKGDQSWVFIGRTDVKAETLILWPPDVKSWLIGKDPDAGRDWGQKEKGTTEVEWHHRLNGQEFEQALGGGDGQGGLACCGSRGRKESDTTERLIWSESSAVIFPIPLQNRKHQSFWPVWIERKKSKEMGRNKRADLNNRKYYPETWRCFFSRNKVS